MLSFKADKKEVAKKNIISEKAFNELFPLRDKFYTYSAFINAVNAMANLKIKIEMRGDWIYKITRTDKRNNNPIVVRQDQDWETIWAKEKPYKYIDVDYADFCNAKDLKTNRKELAAVFAHVAHETRNGIDKKFNDGLMLIDELAPTSAYISPNVIYPAADGKKYYGRGPIQLSYNGNYGFASDCIFGDERVLLNNPDLVSNNAILAFETAIYFWMTPQSAKPSAHDVMVGNWQPTQEEQSKGFKPGFGMTINIVNGYAECNKSENQKAMQDRIGFYQYFLNKFNISDANCACSCGAMQPYAN
ncbi:chitinase [Pedobacter changchengzhani]|nr:chitinase [Pedobacter changchengzhani]